jgi:hypothetical protein
MIRNSVKVEQSGTITEQSKMKKYSHLAIKTSRLFPFQKVSVYGQT